MRAIFNFGKLHYLGLTLIMALLTTSCGESPMAKYSLSELQDAHTKCKNNTSKSARAGVTCDNIQRECDNRAKKKGRKVCF